MCHPGVTQHLGKLPPARAHCSGYGRAGGSLRNHSLPADVVLAPSKPSLVRCPLPLKVLTHQAVPLANPVQRPHTRLYLITQVKPRVFNVIRAKSADLGMCGHRRPAPSTVSLEGNISQPLGCVIPRGAHEEHPKRAGKI